MSSDPSLDRALHAINDPTRRRILAALKQPARSKASSQVRPAMPGSTSSGLCAGDIEEQIKLSQPTVSHHMAILTRAGLVDAVRQGQWRWYRRNEKAIGRLLAALKKNL